MQGSYAWLPHGDADDALMHVYSIVIKATASQYGVQLLITANFKLLGMYNCQINHLSGAVRWLTEMWR